MQAFKSKSFKQFVLAMGAFVILLPLTFMGMALLADRAGTRSLILDTSLRYFIFLIPVVPVFFAVNAFARALGELDEFQRKVQLEALTFSLGGTALLTFTYGFMEYAGAPHVNLMFVLPLGAFLWFVGLVLTQRRYR
jgi:hypothetical protein